MTWGPLLPLRVQHPGKEPEPLGGQSVPWKRGVVASSGRGMGPDLLWPREVGKLERVWGLWISGPHRDSSPTPSLPRRGSGFADPPWGLSSVPFIVGGKICFVAQYVVMASVHQCSLYD